MGVPVGIIAVICAGVLWGKFCRKHIYAELPSNLREIADTGEGKKLPPFGTVLGIILIPLVLILLNTMTDYLSLPAAVKSVFEFLGTPFVSLIIATLCAMFFLGKKQGYSGDDLKKILDRALKPMVQYADLMKISEEGTMLLTGESDYQKAAELLMQSGVKIVVLALRKTGAYVQTRQGGQLVKGFRNKAADATGAGDAFWGGFLFQFSRCGKAPEAVKTEEAAEFADFGNAVASVCVRKHGAIPAMPNMAQVMKQLKEERLEA